MSLLIPNLSTMSATGVLESSSPPPSAPDVSGLSVSDASGISSSSDHDRRETHANAAGNNDRALNGSKGLAASRPSDVVSDLSATGSAATPSSAPTTEYDVSPTAAATTAPVYDLNSPPRGTSLAPPLLPPSTTATTASTSTSEPQPLSFILVLPSLTRGLRLAAPPSTASSTASSTMGAIPLSPTSGTSTGGSAGGAFGMLSPLSGGPRSPGGRQGGGSGAAAAGRDAEYPFPGSQAGLSSSSGPSSALVDSADHRAPSPSLPLSSGAPPPSTVASTSVGDGGPHSSRPYSIPTAIDTRREITAHLRAPVPVVLSPSRSRSGSPRPGAEQGSSNSAGLASNGRSSPSAGLTGGFMSSLSAQRRMSIGTLPMAPGAAAPDSHIAARVSFDDEAGSSSRAAFTPSTSSAATNERSNTPPAFGSRSPAASTTAAKTGARRSRRPKTSGAVLSLTEPTAAGPSSYGDSTSIDGPPSPLRTRARRYDEQTSGSTTSAIDCEGEDDHDQETTDWTQSHAGAAVSLGRHAGGRPKPTRSPTAMSLMMTGSAQSGKRLGREPTMTGRPGWEGEEMLNVLREDGMEVTTLRTASQIPNHLRQTVNAPSMAATRSSKPLRRVLLVPLSDSPTLPSLSLLLAQGTTPSAVCFQQDLLERARRTEADWLPSALDMIWRATQSQGPYQQGDSTKENVSVIAYSANPALSDGVVEQCIQAGALGVLFPPYESHETLRRIRELINEAPRQDRRASAISLASHRESVTAGHSGDGSPQYVRIPPAPPISPIAINEPPKPKGFHAQLALYEFSPRRRSVDTGGIALALQRASEVEECEAVLAKKRPRRSGGGGGRPLMHDIISPSEPRNDVESKILRVDRSASLVESHLEGFLPNGKQQRPEDDSSDQDTRLAELLGAMYRETRIAIEIKMADYDEFSAEMSHEKRAELIDKMNTWDFKPHNLSDPDIYHCACLLFEAALLIDGLQQLDIQRDQLHRWLFAIRAIYHAPNPYHNYIHAIDVLQASYTFLREIGLVPPLEILLSDQRNQPWRRPRKDVFEQRSGDDNARLEVDKILRPQDVLAVMIAAIGHDVGHPGLSNVFMKNAKTPLSQVYEDQSVLENMHCMLMIQLLRKHGFDFMLGGSSSQSDIVTPIEAALSSREPTLSPAPSLANLKRDVRSGAVTDWKGFKKLVYATVLATDMSLHFEWIQSFKIFAKGIRDGDMEAEVRAGRFDSEDYRQLRERGRVLLCQAIIKCADISNPTRPIDVSEHWSTVLLQEWAKQAKLEKLLDLPISTIESHDDSKQAKGQIGFIDLFVQPLFESATAAMPDLQPYASCCAANRASWQTRLETVEAKAAEAVSENQVPHASASPVTASSVSQQGAINPNGAPQAVASHANVSDERYRSLFPLSLPPSLLSTQTDSTVIDSVQTLSPDTPLPSASSASSSKLGGVSPISPRRSGSGSSGSDKVNAAVRAAYRANVARRTPSLRVMGEEP